MNGRRRVVCPLFYFSHLGNGIQDLSQLMVQPVEFFKKKSDYILLIFNQSLRKQCNLDVFVEILYYRTKERNSLVNAL